MAKGAIISRECSFVDRLCRRNDLDSRRGELPWNKETGEAADASERSSDQTNSTTETYSEQCPRDNPLRS